MAPGFEGHTGTGDPYEEGQESGCGQCRCKEPQSCLVAVAGEICGQGAVEGQYVEVAAMGGQQGRPECVRGGEGREQAGEEAGTWPVADFDQEDLIWESQAGSSSAEGQVCTGGYEEEAEPLGKVMPVQENAKGQGE